MPHAGRPTKGREPGGSSPSMDALGTPLESQVEQGNPAPPVSQGSLRLLALLDRQAERRC